MRLDLRTASAAPSSFTSTLSGFTTRIADAWHGFAARVETTLSRPALNDRVLYRLSTMSDRELLDIGLNRSDLADAALPENGDATHFLVARRDGRHNARRGHSPF